ncbi:DUF3021 domain-containing protein [Streptococcus anginosus]|uniref:DUF3021 family protein n=1 Tax=Streptococcus anginosus TaxID=1328 RepID=UPI0014304B2C|nr:DUF3021 family protein [Streptococcus anginosus]NJJ07674.1 DUF3021 domain-containing protein [Streptococcus anginosus]
MLIKKAIIRGIIPLIIMTTISIIMKHQAQDAFKVKSTFLVGIIVTSVAAASVIYEIENWSLFRQSVVHFVTMLVTIFPCLLVSGWFKLNNISDYIKVFGIFLFTGIVLWGIAYFIFGKILAK